VIRRRKSAGATEVSFRGEVTVYTAGKLRDVLLEAVEGAESLVLNLAGVHRLDAAGYQLLVSAKRECARRGVRFKVAAAGEEAGIIAALFGGSLLKEA